MLVGSLPEVRLSAWCIICSSFVTNYSYWRNVVEDNPYLTAALN